MFDVLKERKAGDLVRRAREDEEDDIEPLRVENGKLRRDAGVTAVAHAHEAEMERLCGRRPALFAIVDRNMAAVVAACVRKDSNDWTRLMRWSTDRKIKVINP